MGFDTRSVAEIASGSLAAIRVLERHGIDYCSDGERPLRDVCLDKEIDPRSLLAEIDKAHTPSDDRDWSTAPLRELMDHLVNVDHTAIRAELSVLGLRLQRVVETYKQANATLLHMPKLFKNLVDELEAHMQGEEKRLFPEIERYISAIEAGEPLKGSPLAAFGGPLHLMEQEHESTAAALRLLREFCHGHSFPEQACLRYTALVEGLGELEAQLARHMYLENTVLYPRAAALKANRRWQEAGMLRV